MFSTNSCKIIILLSFVMLNEVSTYPPSIMGNTANEIRNSVNDWLKFSRMKAQKEKAMEAKKKIFDEIPIKGTFYDSDEISLGGFLERIIGIPKIVSLKPSEPLSSNEYSKDYNRLTNVWGR